MDVLVVLATTISYVYSLFAVFYGMTHHDYPETVYFDTSAMLISFIMLGKYLEIVAKGRTSDALKKLMSLQASTAVLLTDPDDQSGEMNVKYDPEKLSKEVEIPIELLQLGDFVKVLPGSSVPSDGVVFRGTSSLDESMITGEARLVKKSIGDTVIGGTVNQHGLLHVQVTKVGSETSLSRIISLVEDAQSNKAPIQRLADTVSSYFVPLIVFLGFVTFIVWFFLCVFGFVDIPEGTTSFQYALMFAISVIVIACPCSLGLATPTAVMVGTGIAAQHGILIKGGLTLEMAHKIKAVVFDKTGTLTHGKFKVSDTILDDPSQDIDKERAFYRLLATAESGSQHPVASAIIDHANFLDVPIDVPENFQSVAGMGIKCEIKGKELLAGNRKIMEENGIEVTPVLQNEMTELEMQSKTVILVAYDGRIEGICAVGDIQKEEASVAINALKRRGITCVMITGDNKHTARSIASEVGIDQVYAEVLPEDKASKVKSLQSRGFVVAFVGDGINDSPALSTADVGIAIGAGTDIAIESADMILVKNDLRNVVTAIDLSSTTFRRILINYVWASLYNLLGVPIAAGALAPWGIVVGPAEIGRAHV